MENKQAPLFLDPPSREETPRQEPIQEGTIQEEPAKDELRLEMTVKKKVVVIYFSKIQEWSRPEPFLIGVSEMTEYLTCN